MEEIKVINNTALLRFEVSLNDDTAMLDYRYYKKNFAIMHTEVPERMKGKGIGTKLVLAALEFAIQQNKKIMLYCPFAFKYVKEHKAFYKYVDTEFHPAFKE